MSPTRKKTRGNGHAPDPEPEGKAAPSSKPDVVALERYLKSIGVDGDRDAEYSVTAALLSELLVERTSGLRSETPMLRPIAYAGKPGQVVSLEGFTVYGLCPHHLVPYIAEAGVRYVPREQVAGAGALVRYVRDLARVPRLQEALTEAIADGIHDFLDPAGVQVWMRGRHLCMELRGAGSHARLVTEARRGEPLPVVAAAAHPGSTS